MKAPSRALQTRQTPRRPTTPAGFSSAKFRSLRFRYCSSPAGSYRRPRVGGTIQILGTYLSIYVSTSEKFSTWWLYIVNIIRH
jgi:hypothetical protein